MIYVGRGTTTSRVEPNFRNRYLPIKIGGSDNRAKSVTKIFVGDENNNFSPSS